MESDASKRIYEVFRVMDEHASREGEVVPHRDLKVVNRDRLGQLNRNDIPNPMIRSRTRSLELLP
jgi:hypothetical protein